MPIRMTVELHEVQAAIGAAPPTTYTPDLLDGALIWLDATKGYEVLAQNGSDLRPAIVEKIQKLYGYRIDRIGHIELKSAPEWALSLRRNLAGLWTVWLEIDDDIITEDEFLAGLKALATAP